MCVLAGGSALLPLLSGRSWVGPTVLTVMLVSLTGVGSRLLRMPSTGTLMLQTASVAAVLTSVFGTTGYAGVVPNAATLREVAALLTGAVDQITVGSAPAPSTPELAMLIAMCLGLAAVIVDFLLTAVRAPALVGMPLLCLYAVPASLAQQLLPWWAFAVPAGFYAALLVIARPHGRPVASRAGIGIAAFSGLVVALAVAGSVVLADSFTPVGTGGRFDRGDLAGAGGTIGLSPFAALHGDLQRGEPRDVLEVSGLPEPDYLRTTALEAWDAEDGFTLTDPAAQAQPAATPLTVTPLVSNPDAQQAVATVRVLNFTDRFLPMYQGTTTIDGLADGYSYNPVLGAVFTAEATRPPDYQLTVAYGGIDPDLLRADTVTTTPELVSADGIGAEAAALAQSVSAPGQTTFDKALLLKNYFTDAANGFEYSLQVPTGNSGNLLTDFLQNKQGYCEQYAAAMTVMLRAVNIPARVAVGFTQGTRTPSGSYLITSYNAHAWVEVRFDSFGWVRFDPTPLSDSTGGQQGFQPDTAPPIPSQASVADVPAEAPPTVDDTASASVFTSGDINIPSGADVPPPTDVTTSTLWTRVVLFASVATIVVAVVAWPSWWRRRRAQRRLALAAHGGPAAADAAWQELEELTIDHGLSYSDQITVRQAANLLALDGNLGTSARAGLKRIVLAAESSWYAADGYASHGTNNLADDVRQIARDLQHTARSHRRHRLIPRSFLHAMIRRFARRPSDESPALRRLVTFSRR